MPHVLIHMDQIDRLVTSDTIGKMLSWRRFSVEVTVPAQSGGKPPGTHLIVGDIHAIMSVGAPCSLAMDCITPQGQLNNRRNAEQAAQHKVDHISDPVLTRRQYNRTKSGAGQIGGHHDPQHR